MQKHHLKNMLSKTAKVAWLIQKPWWRMLGQLSGLNVFRQAYSAHFTDAVSNSVDVAIKQAHLQKDLAMARATKKRQLQARCHLCYWNIGLTMLMAVCSVFFLGGLSAVAGVMMALYIAWMVMCVWMYRREL